jgi:hypothetical protein
MGYVSVGLLDWVRWAGYSKSCTYDVRKSEGTDVLELSAIKQPRGNISGISAEYQWSIGGISTVSKDIPPAWFFVCDVKRRLNPSWHLCAFSVTV